MYERHLGVKIPADYDVHHIDENRNNHEFNNLVSVPRGIHRYYHLLKGKIFEAEDLYGFKSSDIEYFKIDGRFNFQEYVSGDYETWFNGTRREFEVLCNYQCKVASFISIVTPIVHVLKDIELQMSALKILQNAKP